MEVRDWILDFGVVPRLAGQFFQFPTSNFQVPNLILANKNFSLRVLFATESS